MKGGSERHGRLEWECDREKEKEGLGTTASWGAVPTQLRSLRVIKEAGLGIKG